MLISKKVQIEFANPQMRAIDAIQDIRDAAKYAGLNLFSRYDVRLQMPMAYENDKVVVEILIPQDQEKTFNNIGNHLRGIALYLLKNCNGKYDQYIMGKRLLVYKEISDQEPKTEKLTIIDRLEAIVSFAKLLECSDKEAIDRISRILLILNE